MKDLANEAMTIKLDYDLPEYPKMDPQYRRAPRRESRQKLCRSRPHPQRTCRKGRHADRHQRRYDLPHRTIMKQKQERLCKEAYEEWSFPFQDRLSKSHPLMFHRKKELLLHAPKKDS